MSLTEVYLDPAELALYRKKGWSEEKLENLALSIQQQQQELEAHPEFHPHQIFPTVLPPQWRIHEKFENGLCYQRSDQLRVICTTGKHGEHWWAHVSASYKERLPSWSTLKEVKAVFIGAHKKAINVLPPESEFVNLNPFVHHLFSCLTGDVLPDFTRGTGSL